MRGEIVSQLRRCGVPGPKLAPLESGAGLPPTIPVGMRAISVKVNEVIGVAAGESVYLPAGSVHRLENRGETMLKVIRETKR